MFEVHPADGPSSDAITLPVVNRKRIPYSPTALRQEASSDPPLPSSPTQRTALSGLPEPQQSTDIYAVKLTPLSEYEEHGNLPVFEEEFMVKYPAAATQFTIKRSKKVGKNHILGVSSLPDVIYLLDQAKEIEQHLHWQVSPLRPRAPCIQLTNFYYKVTEEFLLGELFNIKNEEWHSRAQYMADTSIIKITNTSVVLQLPPALWHAALTTSPPRIAMFQPGIQAYTPLQQCFRCSRFGHTSTHCEFSTACFRCGGGHEGQQCAKLAPPPPPACANCKRQWSSSVTTPHSVTNHAVCPIAVARKRTIQAQTVYNQLEYDILHTRWSQFKVAQHAATSTAMEDQQTHSTQYNGTVPNTPHISTAVHAHHGSSYNGHAIHNNGPQVSIRDSYKTVTHHYAGSHTHMHPQNPPPKRTGKSASSNPLLPVPRATRQQR